MTDTNTRIMDVEGLRIGDFAIDYDPLLFCMWSSDGWIEQDITPNDAHYIIQALYANVSGIDSKEKEHD